MIITKKKYKINCLLRLQHVEQLVELSREKNIRKQKTRNQNKLTETGKKNSWRARCAWNIYNLNMFEHAKDIEWCRHRFELRKKELDIALSFKD